VKEIAYAYNICYCTHRYIFNALTHINMVLIDEQVGQLLYFDIFPQKIILYAVVVLDVGNFFKICCNHLLCFNCM
jgi:hypothetical protein